MAEFNVILTDECGEEFARRVEVTHRNEVRTYCQEQYPESRVVSISTDEEDRQTEHARYMRIEREFYSDMGYGYDD